MFPLSSTSLQVNWAELARLQFEVEQELEYQARIVKGRDYYEGQFPDALHAELEKSIVGEDLDDSFTALNVNRAIVKSVANRLTVSGIQVKGNEETALAVDGWFEGNGFQAEQDTLHTYAIRDGEAFVIIEPVEDETADSAIDILWHVHERYTDPSVDGNGEGCRAHYDGKKLVFVSKRWTETIYDNEGSPETRMRMTLYFADRIEKFAFSEAGVWEPFQDEGDPGSPITWTAEGQPIGIAVIHFKLRELRPYAKDAWGMQVASDHNLAALFASGQMSGFPMLWSGGAWPTTDGNIPAEDGSNVWKIGPRSIIGNNNAETKVGRVEPGDLSQLLNLQNQILLQTAAVTGTPQLAAMILRANVSGETLKQFDVSQLAEVRRLIEDFTPGYIALVTRSIKIHNAFASSQLSIEAAEGVTVAVSPIWESPEVRDRTERTAEAQAKGKAGVPWEQLLSEWGYGPDEIIEMRKERAREIVLNLLAQAAAAGDQAAGTALSAVFAAWQESDEAAEVAAWAGAITAVGQMGGNGQNGQA